MSQQLRATGETLKLEAAMTWARLLLTIDDHGQTAAVFKKQSKVELLQEQVALTEQVAALLTGPSRTGSR